jgi:hypothetical protein
MSRRTGKAGAGAGDSETSADDVNQVQSLLKSKAELAGLVLADRFQSQVLLSALTAIQSGVVGEQTIRLLNQLQGESVEPFLSWGVLPHQEELPLLPESNGLSS